MKFELYIPCDVLKPYVRFFAIQETADERSYKVLPDTSIVIGFQYSGQLSYISNKEEFQLSAYGLTGLQDGFRIFKNSTNIGTVLVYFKEGGAAAFFKTPLHELFRQSVSLDSFILRSTLLLVEEQLQEAKTDNIRILAIEKFLVSQLLTHEQDKLVLAALSLIYKSKGDIRITDLMKDLNISQSPLEKRFRKMVGTSPKKFASIVRVKHLIQSFRKGDSLTQLAYESGFYDQAHFIREFKTFTGDTPELFFRK